MSEHFCVLRMSAVLGNGYGLDRNTESRMLVHNRLLMSPARWMSCRKRYRLKSYGVVVEFLDQLLMDITVSNRVFYARLGSGKSLWVRIHRNFDGCCYEVESERYRVIR